ncbi:hypothetical protein FHS26_006751 [Rhizobium pisi]|uniref:Uncharacterized protein n=1 Tax=Rhizobium pisi TaxID=574561 RepID=A0A7W5BTP2_9HYPH|nr:hypothetical protein [Rhizobium pisi]
MTAESPTNTDGQRNPVIDVIAFYHGIWARQQDFRSRRAELTRPMKARWKCKARRGHRPIMPCRSTEPDIGWSSTPSSVRRRSDRSAVRSDHVTGSNRPSLERGWIWELSASSVGDVAIPGSDSDWRLHHYAETRLSARHSTSVLLRSDMGASRSKAVCHAALRQDHRLVARQARVWRSPQVRAAPSANRPRSSWQYPDLGPGR